ncbi:MAG: hypothetical protein ACI84R_003108 [Candidatus Azotimanducaceae bacterium]|jgi:hypothetical protein
MKQSFFVLGAICFVGPAFSQSIEILPVTTIADYTLDIPNAIAAATIGARWDFDENNDGIGGATFDGLNASYSVCAARTKPVEVQNGVTCVPRMIGDNVGAFRTVAPAETMPNFRSIMEVTIQDYSIVDNVPSIKAANISSKLSSLTTQFKFGIPETDTLGIATAMWNQTRPDIIGLGNGIELEQSRPYKVIAKLVCDPPLSGKNCEIVLLPVGGEGPQGDAFELEVLWTPDQFEGGLPKLQFKIAE